MPTDQNRRLNWRNIALSLIEAFGTVRARLSFSISRQLPHSRPAALAAMRLRNDPKFLLDELTSSSLVLTNKYFSMQKFGSTIPVKPNHLSRFTKLTCL